MPATTSPPPTRRTRSAPGATSSISCGIKLALPPGRFGRVVMRSGHGFPRDRSCRSGAATATVRVIDPPPAVARHLGPLIPPFPAQETDDGRPRPGPRVAATGPGPAGRDRGAGPRDALPAPSSRPRPVTAPPGGDRS